MIPVIIGAAVASGLGAGWWGATKTAESSKSDIIIEGDASVKTANLTTTVVVTLIVTIIASVMLKKFTKT
ncbi:hypothetical protein QF117_09175 [Vibrio sp. YMD68]|uniref:hypothetical protein n=1 Tax=Vibrio sp. YMD68 TaxID=3042300 RepID=UPI00249C8ED6|nr:hypothetical protein [Vibrio sp. YMD68]WGW00346.1 hypothetical protein QF117_21200 [Vibrio sp. YMD68]WGW00973.1 hypothetical protein QF117_09175 [Vibrio sp. YMD68]